MIDHEPLARYATLHGFVELCTQLGVDSYALLTACGFDIASLAMQDHWVPAVKIAHVLELAAKETGKDNFGMRMAQYRRFSQLGYLSLIIREEPYLHNVLTTLMRHNRLYNEATSIRLYEKQETTTIHVDLQIHSSVPIRQSIELAIGTLIKIMRDTCGEMWEPLGIHFTHSRPEDISIHNDVLGPRVSFQQKMNSIVIRSSDLTIKNALADPILLIYAQQLLNNIEHTPEIPTVHRVKELIEAHLSTGRCSIQQISHSLNMTRRTIHRKLAKADTSFTKLLNSTRMEIAGQLMRNNNNTLTDIAELLGFSSSSNFTRWFNTNFGVTPKQWRGQLENN